MKALRLILLSSCFGTMALAQQISPANLKLLQKKEDSLKVLAFNIVNARDEGARQSANNTFIPLLVNTLKIKGSFFYPFDSLQQISILYPEDSSFRIFTWQMPRMTGSFRYYGTIQLNTKDHSLKLFPLFDNSEFTQHLADTITGPAAWPGCLYYNLVETKKAGAAYYTLFGLNANSLLSNKKILEVLTFRDDKPVFGAPVFSFAKDTVPQPVRNRFILEYKKDGNAGMNYDPELQMILYDHLVPLHNEPQKKYTYVPDGDYEGFVWENGLWLHVEKVFNQQSDTAPVPAPLEFHKNILGKDTLLGSPEEH